MNEKIRAVAVTVSDSRTEADDISGKTLVEILLAAGVEIVERIIISDDFDDLRQTLYVLTEREDVNLIVTTGGTGFATRDNTPEATRAVIDKEAPGLAEAMRYETSRVNAKAWLSRGVCGIRNNTLIINLPGSPKGVKECFAVVEPLLPHAVGLLAGNTKH